MVNLRKAAKGQMCQIRIPGSCNHNPETSVLAHCTDAEALCIDRVISEVLAEHPGLISVLRQRYEGRGMTKRKMAELLNDAHPEWCFSTCEKRIANWLAVAEYALYIPMRESFAQKTA